MVAKVLTLALALADLGGAASAQEVWFGPRAPGGSDRGAPDWEALWRPDASSEWLEAAARTSVFSWNIEHAEGWPQAKLAAEAGWLHAHGIRLAVTVMPLETAAACGTGREGYNAPGGDAATAARLKQAGVTVEVLQMDAPLNFGHYIDGLCQWPVAQTAAAAAAGIAPWLAAYPHAEVADVEGAPVFDLHPQFEADYAAFRTAFEQAAGRRIAALQFDTDWSNPAIRAELPILSAFAHAHGIRFGVFYDGSGAETTDLSWMQDAEDAVETAENALGVIPDDALIASWDAHPVHALPDASPGALAHLVRRYALPRTGLVVRAGGGRLRGRLTDEQMRPVAGAEVMVSRVGLDPARKPPLRVLREQAPADARSAILGWRINTECNCVSDNDVALGDLVYTETSGGRRSFTLSLPGIAGAHGGEIATSPPATLAVMGGESVVRVQVPASATFGWNSDVFPVTPGAAFVLTAPIGSMDGYGMAGYATVIFLDAQQNGIVRDNLMAPQTTELRAAAMTDSQGAFSAPLTASAPGAPVVWRATFAGSAELQPAEADATQ